MKYILFGKNSDMANLRETVTRLFLLREAADTMAVFADSEKKGQAKSIMGSTQNFNH